MANDFTQITRNVATATEAQNLLTAITQLRAGAAAVKALRDRMVHCQDGADFSELESIFGIPTGKGHHVFTLFDGTSQALDGSGYFQDLQNSVG